MVSILVAPHVERIVGFYSGPGTWLSHKVGFPFIHLFLSVRGMLNITYIA